MGQTPTFRGLHVIGLGTPGSDLRRWLVDGVLAGTKTATTGLLVDFELDGATLPVPGTREVVIDAENRFVGEIETTECRIVRIAEVDDAHARAEGDTDATHWREAHERHFRSRIAEIRERLADPSWDLDDDTLVVCRRFRLVERYTEPVRAP